MATGKSADTKLEKAFRIVQKNLGNDWLNLALCLGLSYVEVQQIKREQDLIWQIRTVLEKWRHKEGRKATLEILLSALEETGRKDIADSVEEQLSDDLPADIMLHLILLITAVCTTVCGTSQDGGTQHHTADLCYIRKGCQGIALTKPSPDDISLVEDLCKAVGDKLNSLDPATCALPRIGSPFGRRAIRLAVGLSQPSRGSDLPPAFGQEEDQADKPDHVDGQLPQTVMSSLALSERTNYFSDCSEIHTALSLFNAVSSGVHDIKPLGMTEPISVYCDQTTDGGGWTVIQNRFDGSIDFNRRVNAFWNGFGSADGEHWLGLKNMHFLTNQDAYELYIELEDWDGVVKYAKYESFSVGSHSYYRLSVSGYSGTAGDGFADSSSNPYLTGQPFSGRNYDRDASSGSCAGTRSDYTGGWWYKDCGWSALNGPYLRPSDYTSSSGYGIYWSPFGTYGTYLKRSKMMVRPANFDP
ncbi:hypothetical protein Bbelb_286080 [Branchiostoma belcheri]|nr:hypothetical protein Bbelb_286080 [Branchiostoma belcheri]